MKLAKGLNLTVGELVDNRLFTLNKKDASHGITINKAEAGESAINPDPVIQARSYPGEERTLRLPVAGEEDNHLSVTQAQAWQVWAALSRK